MATFCLRNGHILSCSSGRSPELIENHWLHVKNGRVEATGRGEPMLKEAVEEVDLEGRTVLPGETGAIGLRIPWVTCLGILVQYSSVFDLFSTFEPKRPGIGAKRGLCTL